MTVRFSCAYISNKGLLRSENEDSLLFDRTVVAGCSMEKPRSITFQTVPVLFAVADGMGGAPAGERASKMVLKSLAKVWQEPSYQLIDGWFREIKQRLDAVILDEPDIEGFGTTVAGLVFGSEETWVFNCGDSRVYQVFGGEMRRLTKDHTYVQALCDQGMISEEQILNHPLRHVLTASLSGDRSGRMPDIIFNKVCFSHGDRFLLCTDGVWEMLSPGDLAWYASEGDVHEAATKITKECLDAGGYDNITIILIEISLL